MAARVYRERCAVHGVEPLRSALQCLEGAEACLAVQVRVRWLSGGVCAVGRAPDRAAAAPRRVVVPASAQRFEDMQALAEAMPAARHVTELRIEGEASSERSAVAVAAAVVGAWVGRVRRCAGCVQPWCRDAQ